MNLALFVPGLGGNTDWLENVFKSAWDSSSLEAMTPVLVFLQVHLSHARVTCQKGKGTVIGTHAADFIKSVSIFIQY